MKYIYILTVACLLMSCNQSDAENNSSIGDHYGGNYLETGLIYFNQSWGQENNGYSRPVYIDVPSSSSGPHNIIIVLHGGGGNAENFINNFSYLENHIIVAPTRIWGELECCS